MKLKFNLNHILNVIDMEACQALTRKEKTHEGLISHLLINQTGRKVGWRLTRCKSCAEEVHLCPCRVSNADFASRPARNLVIVTEVTPPLST